MKRIALLIPCYNEEKTIAQVLEDAKKNIPEAEVYVFDNNSTDSSAEIASSYGANVIPVKEQGKGNVVKAMFSSVEADCYLMIDADATYELSDAKALVEDVLEKGIDMALADRLSGDYFQKNKRPFHNFGNSLVRFLVNLLFGGKISDAMTGFRAFSPRFASSFVPKTAGFQIETEMDIFALTNGYTISSHKCQYKDRPEDSPSKLNTYKDGMRVLWLILSSFFLLKPFQAFGLCSLPFIVLGAILGIFPFIQATNPNLYDSVNLGLGYSSLVLLIVGILLFLTGFVLRLIKGRK